MRNFAKKALALFCAISMLFSLTVAVQAEGPVEFTVGSVTAEPGATITVPVSVANNVGSGDPDYPGICCMTLNFKYDADVLTLDRKASSQGDALSGLDMTKPGGTDQGDVNFVWDATDAYEDEGVILNLVFTVAETATAGEHAIAIEVIDCADFNMDDIETSTTDGIVTIPGAEEPGDDEETYDKTTFVVGDVTAEPGDEITVPVRVVNNTFGDPDYPGICCMTLNFKYDADVLTLDRKKSTQGDALADLDMTKPGGDSQGDVNFVWDSTDAYNDEGVILNLVFTVAETATAGEHTIAVEVIDCADFAMDDIDTGVVNGTVTIPGGESDDDEPTYDKTTFVVGDVTAEPGDEITVPVSVVNNTFGDPDYPGICCMTLNFKYDPDVLTLDRKKSTQGDALADLDMTKPGGDSQGDVNFVWDSTDAYNDEGVILNLVFTVNENAYGGEYAIAVEVIDCADFAMDDIETAVVNGTVTVEGSVPAPHEHSYTEEITTPATCGADGVKTFTCTCGDSYTEVIPATGNHDYDGAVTTPATHTTEGVMTYTCSVCGDAYTEVIPADVDNHNYATVEKLDADNHKLVCECGDYITEAHDNEVVTDEPTCGADGLKTTTCKVCGEETEETIPATGNHTYGAWEKVDAEFHEKTCEECDDVVSEAHGYVGDVTENPTHFTEGVMTYTCSDCHDFYEVAIPKTDIHEHGVWEKNDAETHKKVCPCGDVITKPHDWDEGVITTPATHTTEGVMTYTCTVCGETKTEVILADKDAHTWDDGVVTEEPTHTTEGVKTYTCTCGDTKTETIPTTPDHEYDDGVVTQEPTHTVEGIKTFTCICGDTKTETIPTTPDHEYDDGVVTQEPTHIVEGVKTFTCICGDTKTEKIPTTPDHEYDEGVETTPATHVTEGVKTFTCICGETYTEVIPKTPDHEYDEGVITTPATHVTEGVKTFTCICGETYTEVIPKTPDHEYDEGVITTPATHTSEGVMTYTCICGEQKTEVIPADKDAHEYGDAIYVNEEQHQKVCVCGDMIYEAHTWDEGKIALKPTATTDGVMMYTCECGEIKYVIIPSDGTGDTTGGTGETTGGTGETTGGTGETTGSTGETTGGTGETTGGTGDTTGGTEEETCPHFGNGVVTTAPTHTTAGIKTYTCILCGATYTEEIPANEYAHNYAEFEEIDEETHKLICECGDFIVEEHAWDDGVVVTEPEVNKEGVKIYTCECGAQKFEVLPALPGSGDTTGGTTGGSGETTGGTTGGSGETTGGTTGGSGETTGGTTGGSGETTGGTTGGSGETTGGTTGGSGETTGGTTGGSGETTGGTTGGSGETTGGTEEHEHEYDEGVITTPATCGADGVKTYTCACGDSYTEVIPATGNHVYGEGVVTKAPTYAEDGVMTYTCACGATKTEAIAKLIAEKTTFVVGNASAVPGDTITIPVGVYGNKHGDPDYPGICAMTLNFKYDAEALTLDRRASAQGDALAGLDMTKPGGTSQGDVNFVWDSTDAYDDEGVILNLVFVVNEGAYGGDYTIEVTVVDCADFAMDDIDTDVVNGVVTVDGPERPSHVHSYTEEITTPATCGADGVKTFTCACGDTYTEVIPATGEHTYDEGVETTPATHTTEGVKTFTCSVCSATKTEAIAKTPEHTYTDEITTPATHTTEGVKTFTCACGDTYTEVIPKTPDHEWPTEGVITTPATCTVDGVMTYTCICGEQKTEVIPATGHTYGDWAKVDDDNHAKTCASCGDVVTEAHTWGEWVITTPATYTAAGEKTATCSVCNGTKTEVIPKKTSGGGGSFRPTAPVNPKPVDPENPEDPTDKPEEPTDKPSVSVTDFGDVKENDWFYSAVEFAINNNLMVGTSEEKFDPYMDTTRGMVITVLYRLEGEPEVEATSTFADVAPNAYYAKAVAWGQKNGIVAGFSETEYAPDVNVTREQLVAIMQRYAEFKGYDVSHGDDVSLHTYDDVHHVSDWAEESVKYGVGGGLIYGRSESTINPLDNAMRAEFAAIMQRFISLHD